MYRKHFGKIKPDFEYSFAVILHIIHNGQALCYKVTKLIIKKTVIKKSSLLRKEVLAEKT